MMLVSIKEAISRRRHFSLHFSCLALQEKHLPKSAEKYTGDCCGIFLKIDLKFRKKFFFVSW